MMQKLSREEVVRLSENMARLSGVKTSMARKVINNFFDEFREQSGINGASRSMLQDPQQSPRHRDRQQRDQRHLRR
ncbi:hypothetical protein ECZU17_30910 [Escherichia coli]|nr:hypothetical protein ECZU17_30910 [Escherichia coli]